MKRLTIAGGMTALALVAAGGGVAAGDGSNDRATGSGVSANSTRFNFQARGDSSEARGKVVLDVDEQAPDRPPFGDERGRVFCLAVDGSRAVIGYRIDRATDRAVVGGFRLLVVTDASPPSVNPTADGIRRSGLRAERPACASNLGTIAIRRGDIKVRDR